MAEAPRRLYDVPAALLLPAVLFVVLPLKLYLPNRADLEPDLIPYFAVLAAGAGLAVLALLVWAPARIRAGVVRASFFGGLLVLLADSLAPTTLPILDGSHVGPIGEPLSYTLTELALLAALVVCAWKLPMRAVRPAGAVLLLALCLPDLVGLAWTEWGRRQRSQPVGRPQPAAPGRPNVYHLVFDGFSADGFESIIDELGLRSRLGGFVFFPNNRSNHTATDYSFPSFLSGELIQRTGFNRWRSEVLSGKRGLLHDARAAGYSIQRYGSCESRDPCVSERDVELPWQRRARVAQFFDVWLLRVAPNFLQNELYRHGRGEISRLVTRTAGSPVGQELRALRIMVMIDRMLEDEAERPGSGQYVFGHFLLPHLPFVLDRDCRFRGSTPKYVEGVEVAPELYREQASCTARQIGRILARLADLDRHDDSIVVIHADHGNLTRCGDPWEHAMAAEANRRIQAVSLSRRSGFTLDCFSRALLLVKPSGGRGAELQVSPRHTQLLDLRTTINVLARLGGVAGGGLDVLSDRFPRRRALSLVAGSHQPQDIEATGPTSSLRFINLCRSRKTGELNHFVYAAPDGGWTIRPNLHVSC